MGIHTINNHCVLVTSRGSNGLYKAHLFSYDTLVFSMDENNEFHRHWSGWSATTQKDINKAFGIGLNKKAWEAMPVEPSYCIC